MKNKANNRYKEKKRKQYSLNLYITKDFELIEKIENEIKDGRKANAILKAAAKSYFDL